MNRRSADASQPDGLAAFARTLRSAFPGRDDSPLARTLLRLLSQGRPVSAAALAEAADRTEADVVRRLGGWRNIERDEAGDVVGFSGLTLRPTSHDFTVVGQQLHTWCVWDTLFLPALLHQPAEIGSTCPITGSAVELAVAPDEVIHVCPADVYMSFPPPAAADTADITGSFCCHVFFLAGSDAARAWREARTDDAVVDVDAAYELGRSAVAALLHPASPTVVEASR